MNKKGKGPITKDMTMGELVEKYPQAAKVLVKHGMHCIGCHMAAMETIEQGCKSHGMRSRDVNNVIKEMNDLVSKG